MLKKSEPQSLESYMAQIAHELRDLPSQARADEMREIEAHLDALVLASQQLENLNQAQATAVGIRQFGAPRTIGRNLRKAWERKQPEAWWRSALAPITGLAFFVLATLLYNQLYDVINNHFNDVLQQSGSPALYFCFALWILVTFFATGFTAGVVSPKRGVLLTLFYFLYCAYELLMFPSNLEDAIDLYLLLLIVLICPVAALVGTHFGAHHSRKISAITGAGSNRFLTHITASRKFLARIAGDSKLNVQL